ncbi:hypothetical protein HNY73_016368 [Argiope bruennichi]|uniref:Dynein regulatory complex protein 1 C-terminal domain-containing protein n=1 Tax=Argiope bruennichi TaxID=94029 RepID=A0A8T0EMI6_ARGBR|nr:hypothetical protein HNY73_016368 [Argiope bruennichi]
MIKVFGDLQPYNFFVTYGHFDERHLKGEYADISIREKNKSQPFERLNDLYEIDKKAEEEFHKFLEDRKRECVKVFEQFDEIIALCEEYFEMEYADCERRMQEQMAIQKPAVNDVERYLAEVQEAGDKEISILKNNIANYIREVGLSRSSKIEEMYAEMSAQPLIMEVWSKCAEAITSKEVWYSFLKTQQDTALLWKQAFEDLMMLSSELERYRYNYNMTKSNLERAIYWMNRNYRDNMPELTKIQRKISSLVDRKLSLYKELIDIERDIRMEAKETQNLQFKYYNKIANMRTSIKLAHARVISKHNKAFKSKKIEILELLHDILKGDQYIHEKLLNKPWDSKDISFLEEDESTKLGDFDMELQVHSEAAKKKPIRTLHEDEFADAYRMFISDGDFVNVLNHIAEELGYVLDFQWVDYIKKTLEMEQKVRWLELFKIFKIDFVEDIKNLKEHMKQFSKKQDGETVFDLNGVLDGFLHFVWLKRQTLELQTLSPEETPQEIYKEFWNSVDEIIPKTLLWDSVFELLEKYRESLQSRKRLLETRFDMVLQNEELDRYLKNYYNYDIPKKTRGTLTDLPVTGRMLLKSKAERKLK